MDLPELSGSAVIGVLKKKGFKVLARRGAHTVLRKGRSRVIVPGATVLATATFESILDQAHVKKETFIKWLEEEKFIKSKKKQEQEEDEIVEEAEDAEKLSFIKNAWIAESRAAPIALFRAVIGVLFLTLAFGKAPWNNFGWFPSAVGKNISNPTFGFWADFNQYIISNNISFFGWLQFLIELSLGIMLLFGLLTVLAAFVGQFWVIIIWMGSASWGTEWEWTYIMWFMAMFIFWTTKAGRCFGIDQILTDKVGAYEEHSKFYRFLSWLL